MKIIMNDISKTYAGDYILSNLSLEIVKGSKSAIVGENGSGKTTLLKIIARVEPINTGTLTIPRDMSVGYMKQIFDDFPGNSRDFILDSFLEFKVLSKRLRDLEKVMSTSFDESVLHQYSKVLEKFEGIQGYDIENKLESYAKGLGVYDILNQSFNTLSGGQKTRIALVQLLLQDYEVLCLDEPTNHLDLQGIEWLESFCRNTEKTLIIVSHDRTFLMNTVSVFHEIEDSKIVSYYGTYDSYRDQRHQRFLHLVNNFEEQNKEIQKLRLAAKRYRQWGNESDNEDFYKRAKAIEKRLERIERLPKPIEIKNQLKIKFKVKERSGKIVFKAEDVAIGYTTSLREGINFEVNWGERFAIVAENGVGKSTLINTMIGSPHPLSGTLDRGSSVKIAYLPQNLEFASMKQRILETIREQCHLDEETARRYLARFGFYQADMYKPIAYLSGGERIRVKLLEMMLSDANCIILDEPTNHLDIASCEIIEEALRSYEGTIIVVSHDRMFLENLEVRKYIL